MTDVIERIAWQGQTLCYLVAGRPLVDRTTFFTPPECSLQVGHVVHRTGAEVTPHTHLPVERHTHGTAEVLMVLTGRCEVDIYSDTRKLVATRMLGPGDVIVLVAGGHGFRMLEDTMLLEVKQGPYPGPEEKVAL